MRRIFRKPTSTQVYSSEAGLTCEHCGRPRTGCACKPALSEQHGDSPVPDKITARLRIEKSGRRGKTVTVVDGLPTNQDFLERLAKDLKTACGSGGTSGLSEGSTNQGHSGPVGQVEVQGDHRERLRPLLESRGFTVKG